MQPEFTRRVMTDGEYKLWCALCDKFNQALKAKADRATCTVDAADMEFIIRWIEVSL